MKPTSVLPKISVVMPSFNSVDFIERSIRSVVEQDYSNTELFIKDGGSDDGTIEIIKRYSKKYPRIIKWQSRKDKGQTDAINIGMKKISGDILTYLNADDVYMEGSLKKVGEYFHKNPKTMWVYGKCNIIDGYDKEIRPWITQYKNFWMRNYSYITLLVLNYISQMGVFWRKEASEKIGSFDSIQHYVMDYDYWLRLGEKYKPGFINEYLASFRIVPQTKSSTGFIKQFQDEYKIAKKHTENSLILALHTLHNKLIIFVYSLLRMANSAVT